MLVMQNLIDTIQELKKKFPNVYLNTIELGTIRTVEDAAFGQSTACISRALGICGNLISVDINIDSIEISKEMCHNASNVTWIQSDSIKYLKGLKNEKFHFAFLDTVNNKDFVFEEFCLMVPKMLTDGILMIDDAGIKKDGQGIDTNVAAQKGHKVWKFLKSFDISFLVISNIHGTQIKIVFDLANTAKIVNSLKVEGKI